jgi:hypothetical protein
MGMPLSADDRGFLDRQCVPVKKGDLPAITRTAFIDALIQGSKSRDFDLLPNSGRVFGGVLRHARQSLLRLKDHHVRKAK